MSKLITMRIKGVSDILMNSPASMGVSQTAQRGGKKIPEPYDEAKPKLYVIPGGTQLYIPSDAFREASLIASQDIRDTSRKGRATMTRRFSAAVFLSKEHCPLERADGKPITSADEDWTIDRRRAVVQRQGVMRSRPRITAWECELELEYDEELIDENFIRAIVGQAGKYPGVMDYRVGKKGPFGRYMVMDAAPEPKGKRGRR
jgi:hypothetical protein